MYLMKGNGNYGGMMMSLANLNEAIAEKNLVNKDD